MIQLKKIATIKNTYIKMLHFHTGFNDFCLFWWSNGILKDLFFIKFDKKIRCNK